ncbi:hypothetical protein ANANG_G00102830 [Anguilla anguilla]|uniref:sphingomyelin phosphodiesterase n=1 Tax=Anguilla anguilla TaxID=7936 RepID=A0A9D3RYS0_ANGAN|nr:hypothetical protein ANANG_G00102830 [Anguilla anguilla]
MVLHTRLFPSASLRFLNDLSWALIHPCYWLLDHLVASFLTTTQEQRQCTQDPCASLTPCVLLVTPLYLLLAVVWLPVALLGFLVWAPLQAVRRPYAYGHRRTGRAEKGWGEWKAPGRRSFGFASANVCLLPDSLARFNNLADTQGRACELGRRIFCGVSRPRIRIYVDSPTSSSVCTTSSQTFSLDNKPDVNGREDELEGQQTPPDCPLQSAGVQISISDPGSAPKGVNSVPCDEGVFDSCVTPQESLTGLHRGNKDKSNGSPSDHAPELKKCARPRKRSVGDGLDHEVSAFFPANLDFLCLQEVFDRQAAVKLKQQLHHYFPFILSDVGRYAWKGCCSQFKFLNSGLMLASQYPILDADYHCFPNGRGEDALAAKGVLFAKVQVGKSSQGKSIVGYIACTHLHSIEGDSVVRCEQLNMLLEYGAYFRKATKRQKDQVAFEVLLGDLNFDNCSSEDKLEQQHILFSHYKDPCRVGPGEDQPWALGTLLEINGLYDEEVCTPERMQKVMENEEGRNEYLAYPPGKKHCFDQEGQAIPLKGNGRRIDYILYSEEGLQQDWKVGVEEYSFITQLAGLTDHLAVAMRLAVSMGEEEL